MMTTVDAMELFHADHPAAAFGIVSSDADFTPLAMHLRSKGAAVYGFGAQQTPKPFVNARSRFLYLEALGVSLPPNSIELDSDGANPGNGNRDADSKVGSSTRAAQGDASKTPDNPWAPGVSLHPARRRTPTAELRQDARLLQRLRDAVQRAFDEDGWAKVGGVGHQTANKTSFDAGGCGHASLSKWLAATQAFDLRAEGSPQVAVRDKRSVCASASV